MATTDHQREVVKEFAVDVLGCGCPDEVFQTIETSSFVVPELSNILVSRIVIGNRLLIYLAPDNKEMPIKTLFQQLVPLGKNERDESGYNRFRLVVYADEFSFDPAEASLLFSTFVKNDDRIFFHTVEKRSLSHLLQLK